MPWKQSWTGVCVALLVALPAGCGPEQGAPRSDAPPSEATPSEAPRLETAGGGATAAPARRCGYRSGSRLTGDGIAGLRVGRVVADLNEECLVLSDTVDPLGPEGMPRRLLRVEFGTDTITVEVADDRVFRLSVEAPGVRTIDELGVGTTLGELLTVRDVRGVSGEGALFAVSPSHCGLSFALGPEPATRPGGPWTRSALAELADTLSVRRVLAYGCRP